MNKIPVSRTERMVLPPEPRLRFERYTVDGYEIPTNWNGAGQPTKWKKVPLVVNGVEIPKTYCVLIHDPVRHEGCELHKFNSPEDRREFIDGYEIK